MSARNAVTLATRSTPAGPGMLWRLMRGLLGLTIGAAVAGVLLAGIEVLRVGLARELVIAYFTLGSATGLLMGLASPPPGPR